VFVQLVVDLLGVSSSRVEIGHGDTARSPFGLGTYGSRSAAVGGAAIAKAVLALGHLSAGAGEEPSIRISRPLREAQGRYSRQITAAAGARGHSIPRARGADFPPPRSPAAANLSHPFPGAAASKRWLLAELDRNHLVEELAGIIWRKRRLRLGESAAHRLALRHACEPYQHTAEAALINVTADVEAGCIGDAVRTTDEQTAEDTADLIEDQAMTEEALRILAGPSSSAYSRALAALREDTQGWWHEQLSSGPDDSDEDQTPYRADTESLKRFLENEVSPWYEKRRRELENRPLIRTQAFGEAVDPNRLERLARYEVHLDRKLERMLAMLFKLQELRRAVNPT
jgi:Molybdopterin-binding domain of aldehyde dehydrogenase